MLKQIRRVACKQITVKPVTTDHPLVPAKAVFSSRWSLVRGLHRTTIIIWIQSYDMYIKMQLIQFPRTCAMPFLIQVKQHLERKTERWRETEREREKINLFCRHQIQLLLLKPGVKRSLWKFRFALSFEFVHAINRTDYPCCDFLIV